LGILLTDLLAPQLVTFCFMAVAAIVVYRFIEQLSPGSLWPWVGTILLLGFYVYTPGRSEFLLHGGWADFEKLHELNAALVIAILWMETNASDRDGRPRPPWVIGAISATTAAVLINVTISIYLGAVFCFAAAWSLVRGRRASCLLYIALACVSGA